MLMLTRRLVAVAALVIAALCATHPAEVAHVATIVGPDPLTAHSTIQATIVGPDPLYVTSLKPLR
jgi:hypothetical protein